MPLLDRHPSSVKPGLPEQGTYLTFKKAVLDTCVRLPAEGSYWHWTATERSRMYHVYEDVQVLTVEITGKGAVITVQFPNGGLKQFSGEQWAAADVVEFEGPKLRFKPKPGTLLDTLYTAEYRIFGTETGRLRCR